jgi:hypothetical protein
LKAYRSLVEAFTNDMDHNAEPDMTEYFNFAEAAIPEENGQIDVDCVFSAPNTVNSATGTCLAQPEGNE